jgi:hypothetical protein
MQFFTEDKKQIIQFLSNLSEKENIDNKINSLSDNQIDIIFENLNCENNLEILQEAGVVGNLMGIVLFGVHWVAWRTALATFSQHQRKCGIFKISNRRDICVLESKIEFTQNKIKILERLLHDKTTSPQKADRIKQNITELKNKIEQYKGRIEEIKEDRDLI